LLEALLSLEQAHGRIRTTPNAPRTLDLDLILYGDAVLDEPGLVVPHPRFRERLFVLEPLAEIANDLVDPATGLSVGELYRLRTAALAR
jgi:2-amino-4-hydroxy-6-hydroxymethyldihydropteridine diphosphokinase